MYQHSYKKSSAIAKTSSVIRSLGMLGICSIVLFVIAFVVKGQEAAFPDTNTPTPCTDFAWIGGGSSDGQTRFYRGNLPANGEFTLEAFAKTVLPKSSLVGGVPVANRQINAIGYSFDDGFFYGLTPDDTKGAQTAGKVYRIASDGHGYQMSWGDDPTNKISELPEASRPDIYGPSYFAGDVRSKALPDVDGKKADGYLYTFNLDNTNKSDNTEHYIYAINVHAKDRKGDQAARLADISPGDNTSKGLKIYGAKSRDLAMNDWSFSPVDGKLYAYESRLDRVMRINPETGGITELANSSIGAGNRGRAIAGTWFDASNHFYVYLLGGKLIRYKINVSEGRVDGRILAGVNSKNKMARSDGASCPFIKFEKEAQTVDGDNIYSPGVPTGTKVRYEYKIRNNANKSLKGNFEDDLDRNLERHGRKFVSGTVRFDSFSGADPDVKMTDTKLTVPKFTVPKNTTATITVEVQTDPNDTPPSRGYLLNQASLSEVTVGDNAPVGSIDSDWPRTPSAVGDPTKLFVRPLDNIPRDKPYLKVYGNDISAGSGFYEGDTCYQNDDSSDIASYSKKSGGDWVGSSGQLGVFATGNISGLFSAGMRNNKAGDSARPFTGLTFGNYNGSILSEGGGQTELRCISDYYKLAEDGGATKLTDDSITGRTVDDGEHKVEYIDGNVTISDNILFDKDGGWMDLTQIPSYTLIVRGNIYIRNNVTRLDGMFIAQPRIDGGAINANTGNIYTCTTGGESGEGNTSPAAASDCDKKLTINGAFIARQVRFLRTRGDIDTDATSDEGPDNKMAEVFNFSQDINLAPLGASLRRTVPYQRYDYITSLPPVL